MGYKDPVKQREFNRVWIAKRRAEFFTGKRCSVWWCGSTDKLELDHIDPKKKVHHAIWSWSKERRDVEIAKCQILCRPCHREKTNIQLHEKVVHGSDTTYNSGCRCVPCRQFKSKKNKKRNR